MKKKRKTEEARFKVFSRELVLGGYLQIDKLTLQHRLFEKDWGPILQREVVRRGNAVAVLLLDIRQDKVVLIEQFRPAVMTTAADPWLIEIVAGMAEPQEYMECVAQRETREETGLSLRALWLINEYWPAPGFSDEKITLYCGLVDATKAGGIFGLKEEGENIRVYTVSFQEAYRLVEKGDIKTSPAIIALQWLQLHEHQLKEAWINL